MNSSEQASTSLATIFQKDHAHSASLAKIASPFIAHSLKMQKGISEFGYKGKFNESGDRAVERTDLRALRFEMT